MGGRAQACRGWGLGRLTTRSLRIALSGYLRRRLGFFASRIRSRLRFPNPVFARKRSVKAAHPAIGGLLGFGFFRCRAPKPFTLNHCFTCTGLIPSVQSPAKAKTNTGRALIKLMMPQDKGLLLVMAVQVP